MCKFCCPPPLLISQNSKVKSLEKVRYWNACDPWCKLLFAVLRINCLWEIIFYLFYEENLVFNVLLIVAVQTRSKQQILLHIRLYVHILCFRVECWPWKSVLAGEPMWSTSKPQTGNFGSHPLSGMLFKNLFNQVKFKKISNHDGWFILSRITISIKIKLSASSNDLKIGQKRQKTTTQ